MKEGLIRITDEKDIFYDSVEKVYRYRMHCPSCGKVVPICRCYQDIEELLMNIDEGIANYTCSSKCTLLIGEWDEIDEAMQTLGLYPDISELTEEQASQVLTILTENDDVDYPPGKDCTI